MKEDDVNAHFVFQKGALSIKWAAFLGGSGNPAAVNDTNAHFFLQKSGIPIGGVSYGGQNKQDLWIRIRVSDIVLVFDVQEQMLKYLTSVL